MKFLCPTDMSPHSITALKYAVNLSNDLDAELHIINAFKVPNPSSSFKSLEDEIKRNCEEDLAKVVAGILPLVKNDRIPISKTFRGNPVQTVLRYSNLNDIDLVIMGTQGDNSLRTLLFGSVTKKVAAQSKVPILAIPEVVKDQLQSNRILMALDNKILDNEVTFRVPRGLASRLGLKIDILHISNEDEEFPIDPFVSNYLGDTMGDVYIKKGNDPVKEIKKYAEENNVGMLIMVRRERSFFNKLFNVGNTAEEIAKTNIPLLILPE